MKKKIKLADEVRKSMKEEKKEIFPNEMHKKAFKNLFMDNAKEGKSSIEWNIKNYNDCETKGLMDWLDKEGFIVSVAGEKLIEISWRNEENLKANCLMRDNE